MSGLLKVGCRPFGTGRIMLGMIDVAPWTPGGF